MIMEDLLESILDYIRSDYTDYAIINQHCFLKKKKN